MVLVVGWFIRMPRSTSSVVDDISTTGTVAPQAISITGTDGSGEFNDQHGGDRRPEQELAAFYIGVLKK